MTIAELNALIASYRATHGGRNPIVVLDGVMEASWLAGVMGLEGDIGSAVVRIDGARYDGCLVMVDWT